MHTARVSVVIPVYNGERYLAHTLDKVLGQSYSNIEIVAVDDGSTDGSNGILNQYRDRIVIIRQQNAGVSAARNAGIRESSGEYIAFLDQDDWWLPSKTEQQVQVFNNHSETGFVHTAAVFFDDTRSEAIEPFNNERGDLIVGDCFPQLLLGNGIIGCSVMVRRSVLDRVGGFDTEICGNTVQDYDLWLRCAQVTQFSYIPEPLSVYRIHAGQGMWNVLRSHTDLLEMLQRQAAAAGCSNSSAFRSRIAGIYRDLGVEHLDASDSRNARTCFRHAVLAKPAVGAIALYVASLLPQGFIAACRRIRSQLRMRMLGPVQSLVPKWTGRVNNDI